MAGVHAGYDVTFDYTSPDSEDASTVVTVDLGAPGGFRMRLWHGKPRQRESWVDCYGFAGTATPTSAAIDLMDRATCDLLVESRVESLSIDTFDPKDYLPRRVVRKIEKLPDPAREEYRTRYHLRLCVRGWIEEPERAVTAITLAVDIATRIGDACTRAAAEDAPRDGAPYRDLPTGVSPKRQTPDRSYGSTFWAILYRFGPLIVLALLAALLAALWT